MSRDFRRGLLQGVPIFLGYLAVSFSFGIFAVKEGLSVLEAIFISMTNLTSAGQLAGVPIITGGGSLLEMGVTQLMINLRYSLMSVSLSQKFDASVRLPHRFLIALGVTDEIFAVSASSPHTLSRAYMIGLAALPYAGWTAGTILGAVAGNLLGAVAEYPLAGILLSALGMAIYGMFIALIVPEMKIRRSTALCVLLAVALGCAFYYLPYLNTVPSGFVIILCSVAASALFAVLAPLKEAEKEATEE
ncbi:MAG: AzlC family ABC transporter permease [Clostridia bacterium]|nr:AzlC family ABC transporter permease [Clostridia bacterium]